MLKQYIGCAIVSLIGIVWTPLYGYAQLEDTVTSLDKAKEIAVSSQQFILVNFRWDSPEVRNHLGIPTETGLDYDQRGNPCLDFNLPGNSVNQFVYLRCSNDRERQLRTQYFAKAKTAVILDAFGNELYAEVCPGKEKLFPILQAIPPGASKYYALLKASQDHPDSIQALLALADHCQLIRGYTASSRFYTNISKHPNYEKDAATVEHVHSRLALNAFLLSDYDKAEDMLSENLEQFPDSPERPMQLFLLLRIKASNKEKDEAMKLLEMLQSKYPNDQHTSLGKSVMESYKE